jgi:hypothetical protein
MSVHGQQNNGVDIPENIENQFPSRAKAAKGTIAFRFAMPDQPEHHDAGYSRICSKNDFCTRCSECTITTLFAQTPRAAISSRRASLS